MITKCDSILRGSCFCEKYSTKPFRMLTAVRKTLLSSASKQFASRTLTTEATFDLPECPLHKFDIQLPKSATLSRDDAMKYLRDMVTIRRMETSANSLYKTKEIRGFLHLYSGQVGGIKNDWPL